MGTILMRAPVTGSAIELIDRSLDGVLVSAAATTSGERYVAAHLAALRAAAAVLAVRGRPAVRSRGPVPVWDMLARVAPELAEWAAYFASGARARAAVEAGRPDAVTPREADDLLRAAETFRHLVEETLGVPARMGS